MMAAVDSTVKRRMASSWATRQVMGKRVDFRAIESGFTHRKFVDLPIEIVDLPIEIVDLPMEIVDLPIKIAWK